MKWYWRFCGSSCKPQLQLFGLLEMLKIQDRWWATWMRCLKLEWRIRETAVLPSLLVKSVLHLDKSKVCTPADIYSMLICNNKWLVQGWEPIKLTVATRAGMCSGGSTQVSMKWRSHLAFAILGSWWSTRPFQSYTTGCKLDQRTGFVKLLVFVKTTSPALTNRLRTWDSCPN